MSLKQLVGDSQLYSKSSVVQEWFLSSFQVCCTFWVTRVDTEVVWKKNPAQSWLLFSDWNNPSKATHKILPDLLSSNSNRPKSQQILTNPAKRVHGVVFEKRYVTTSPSGSSLYSFLVNLISCEIHSSEVVRHSSSGRLAVVVFRVSNTIPDGPRPYRGEWSVASWFCQFLLSGLKTTSNNVHSSCKNVCKILSR